MVDTMQSHARLSPGHMHLFLIEPGTSLLPIIQAHTLPNTVIHSDDYSTYRTAVGQLPNVTRHRMVNHSLHFVDPVANACTLNSLKVSGTELRGVDSAQLPSYLDEFMCRERYGQTTQDCMDNLFRDIAHDYPDAV